MTPDVMVQPLVERLRSHPSLWRRARALRLWVGAIAGSRQVRGVDGPVHWNDLMLRATDERSVAHYRAVADELLAHVERHVSWLDAGPVLDLGAGYGRLTRELVRRVEPSRVTVCDTDPAAVEFCRAAFRVHGLSRLADRDERFGLAVALTVFTNLPAHVVDGLVRELAASVPPGGLLVVTTHGWDSVRHHLADYGRAYPPMQAAILRSLEASGEHFVRYPYRSDAVGMAWHTPEWIADTLDRHGFDLIELVTAGLDGHQDVHVARRRRPDPVC